MSHRSDSPHRLPGGRAGSVAALCAAVTLCLGDLWAGDILRGGAPAGDAARRSAAANQATAAAAAAARNSARDSLARTSNALNAVKAMQAAARAAAAGRNAGMNPNAPGTPLPNVPNGLAAGGLQVDPGVIGGTAVWRGANLPTQSQAAGRTLVNIKQTQQTALLSWQTFNVGRETTLNFDQSAGGAAANKWIAFNKVNDPSNAPSQILGSIQAPGQVYVINRNGIIFGAGSQVNVATLVASSLPINDNLIERGLLNNPDAQFLFSGIAIPAGANGMPAFTPEAPNPLIGRYGDVAVQAGATIVSPTNEAGVGGRVMLVGPNVRNSGSIHTPDGQTILAAGLQVGIDAHATSDPSLRGLDVYVGAVQEAGQPLYAGTVTHDGYANVSRGSAMFVGREVRQFGAIDSSTTVAVNGRIDLLAYYDAISNPNYNAANPSAGPPFLVRNSGTVRFGPGSVTSVLPDLGNTSTTIGSSLPLDSRINVSGRAIYVGRDARLHAPGGDITISAGEWKTLAGAVTSTRFVSSLGQVYLDAGATIDVAGTAGVSVPLTQNLLTLELRGSELANSPLQRDGALRGVPITVDIRNKGFYNGLAWVGTPLGDVSGFAALIPRTVDELTVRGGSVTISAGDSVVMQPGSVIDVSGGHINYQGAVVKTTRLLSNGRLFDIKDATPDRVYDGIYEGKMTVSSARWGVTETFAQPLALTGEHFEPSYIHGADGGSIDITAPAMALDGEFLGRTVNGPRQRSERAGLSSLRLAFLAVDATYPTFPNFSPNPPRVVFGEESLGSAAPFKLLANGNAVTIGADRKGTVFLSPDLFTERGFGKLTVENPDGEIDVPAGVNLDVQPLGEVALRGSNIEIGGQITAPGGKLTFNSPNLPLSLINLLSNTSNPLIPDPIAGRGRFFLAPGARLSVAGLIADDRVESPVWSPLVTAGGTVSIAGFDTTISEGSLIDVSGGVQMPYRSKAVYGNAGTLEIAGGRDLTYPGVIGGSLSLGGTLLGYSGARGGTLRLTGPAFHIGGGAADPRAMRIDPEFFSEGGFASFALSGIGLKGATLEDSGPGITIAPGTRIRPVVEGLLAIPHPAGPSRLDLVRFTRPEGMRTPASLEFNALGAVDPFTTLPIVRGDLVMGEGASIETDALGSATFTGDTVTLLGSVKTPGGSITIRGANRYPAVAADAPEALPTVYIGSRAVLDAAGKAVVYTNARGWREGSIHPGGSIRVSGNIVAESGAVFDVSGTTGVLDLPNTYLTVNSTLHTGLRGVRPVPVRFDTNGGSITLTGSQLLYTDATLIGRPGGPTAIGGSLSVSSGKFRPTGAPFNTAEANLVVKQSGLTLPASGQPRGVGIPLRGPGGTALPGIGNLAVSSFASGGFDNLTLGGNIKFEGPVRIDMPGSIRVATGGVIYADNTVDLSATYVALGQPFRPPSLNTEQVIPFTQTDASGATTPYTFAPTWGTGRLTVRAELIDIGDLSLQGIGSARLLAPKGDVRGNGTLQIAGDLLIQAGQIYPTTLGNFNLYAYDYNPGSGLQRGSVTILGGELRPLPLAGAGTLSIQASNIHQGGTLRAPLGVINLGWDGTGTAPVNPLAGSSIATPVTQNLTLAAGSVTSVSAIDPITGQGILIPYGISFDGNSWIDPAGNDITVGGLPTKAIRLAGSNVTTEAGSTIDIRGGGDLYAYRWAQGNGGTIDILASEKSFAVIPGYNFFYAPYAPFNDSAAATNLADQAGYVNSTLKVGDRITLGNSPGLRGGTYTLLPARYALLPGAFLVTPSSATPFSGPPIGTFTLPDGSSLVSGYRSNDLDSDRAGRTAIQRFEVAPGQVVRQRAEYFDYYANDFLRAAAVKRDFRPPRLPIDSGYLAFSAIQSMAIGGDVLSAAPAGGRGSLIDISSPIDIVINDTGSGGAPGTLTLSASKLSAFNAESLLIGGLRTFGTGSQAGTATVNVTTSNISVENQSVSLKGSDIILAAKGNLSVAPGSILSGTGSAELDRIVIGSATVAGSGDGALIRVSGSENAPVTRLGVGNSTAPNLTVGAGAIVSGGSVTLDSTYATSLDPTATVAAPVTALNSGQISVQLNDPGALNPTVGLVLSGQALETLQQSARDLSLLSYSTFDVYGNGTVGSRALSRLAIQASAIRGFNTGGGEAIFSAQNLVLENATGRSVAALPINPLNGRLTFDANQIILGSNDLRIERFGTVGLRADSRILNTGIGSLNVTGALEMMTPLITGTGASRHTITAGGALRISRPGGALASEAGGLGADLTLQGASVDLNTDVLLPSGRLNVVATAGALNVGNLDSARLSVAGTSRNFLDAIRHTDGGTVNLTSQTGSVTVGGQAVIDVSAPAGGGNAGFLNIAAPGGAATLDGTLLGGASAGRRSGSFSLDANTVTGGSLTATDAILNAGQFLDLRDYRVRSGNLTIGGVNTARVYRAAADNGSLTVTGTIDASGVTGGEIQLAAKGSLILQNGARLDASADRFNAAGKGGSIVLEAGTSRNGVIDAAALLDLRTGSTIDLSVAENAPGDQALGRFTGTLHLRAPQTAGFNGVQMNPIGSTITGASSILVEPYRLYDVTGSGLLNNALRDSILANSNTFLGAAGSASATYTSILNNITSLQPGLDLIIAPGAEIINRTGSLTLGTSSSNTANDWNLAGFRFGPRSAAGVLTLRAADNIVLNNAISDGFSGGSSLWLAPLMANNALLPDNAESWSYRFTAGADTASAGFRETRALSSLADTAGFLQLGKNMGSATAVGGNNALTSSIVGNNFNVIRTGSGNIDITAARSIQLLNPFASIYTAGTQVADPNSVIAPNDFITPILNANLSQGSLGAVQQIYPAQYSLAGGNVALTAGENIERKTRNNSGLIDDSSRQLPNNWLNRRGYVGPDGNFGNVLIGFGFNTLNDPAASTTWWVDFSNFFQDVGALGGGNVSLIAGQDVKNVGAALPTNARAPMGAPNAANLRELGGGDLLVRSGSNIDAGVYYVEKGSGTLDAGGAITTNATRSPSLGLIQSLNNPDSARFNSLTWMPTTLFAGRSSFDVTARGDVLMGPVANPFLLPTGLNNRFWYKTYFNTYGADSAVNITSLGGDVTLRNAVTLPDRSAPVDILRIWLETQNLLTTGSTAAAFSQPWLRIGETSVEPFSSVLSLRPPTLKVAALSGDIDLAGNFTLYPSPTGQLELLASGSVNALQPTGLSNIRVPGQSVQVWTASSINVSDSDPATVPGAINPFNYFGLVGSTAGANNTTRSGFMASFATRFTESGSTTGTFAVSQTKQALHTPGLLHLNDPDPVRLYALGGDLSGLTLFTPKTTRVHASNDIADIAFYLQNLAESDASIITAGRDIVPYNASTQSRSTALSTGNALGFGQSPLAGDILLGGPGSIQVLAGRNLDLGSGSNNADGTGIGLSTVGNARNPFLPFEGAHIVAGAGIGTATSLLGSDLQFDSFIEEYVKGANGQAYLDELEIDDFDGLSPEEQARVALEIFYLVLRDAGRNFNTAGSPGFGNYDTGFAAIESLFGTTGTGDILTQSRNIRTKNGGNISLFAPGGGLSLSDTLDANATVPPGIVTEYGGNVSIFTDASVDIGVGRIFTLRGGDMIIWSSNGDIAAGTASKTVQSAPPTRVLIDPQSATVETDLAGLATGGGIGVLATVAGVMPGNVDLIAPSGIIDAGDAGIRVSGNINLAATQVLNASNIAAGGSSSGAPSAPAVSSPNIGGITSAGNTAAATSSAATTAAASGRQETAPIEEEVTPSIITVEVLGYGGGSAPEEDEEEKKRREKAGGENSPGAATPPN